MQTSHPLRDKEQQYSYSECHYKIIRDKKTNYFSHTEEKNAVCLVQLTNRLELFSFKIGERKFLKQSKAFDGRGLPFC